MYKFILIGCFSALFLGCGSDEDTANITFSQNVELSTPDVTIKTDEEKHVKAFFGDKLNNRVVIIDIEKMKFAEDGEVYTDHKITYTADKVIGKDKVYVVNRGSDAIDVVDTNTHRLIKTIPLRHHPRSAEAMNKVLGLCAVSGMDKPMVSIIDINTDEVVAVVGDNQTTYPVSNVHGGTHACGHPYWLDKTHFVVIDRARKKISTYAIFRDTANRWKTRKLNEIDTPTSVHQIIPSKGRYQGEKNIFYATSEGDDEHYPAILKFLLTDRGLVHINDIELKKAGVDKKNMGLHHADFHPFEKYIYVGSSDGTFFIVDYSDMELKVRRILSVGKGAGHTVMIPARNLAIVINHKDKFISVIDTLTHRKIKDIRVSYVSDDLVGKNMIQAHPKYYVSKDSKFFYAFLTEEGILYKLDLERLEVVETLWVGGKPAQGAFVSYGAKANTTSEQTDIKRHVIDFSTYLAQENMVKEFREIEHGKTRETSITKFDNLIKYEPSDDMYNYLHEIGENEIKYYTMFLDDTVKDIRATYKRYMTLGVYNVEAVKRGADQLGYTYMKSYDHLDFYGFSYSGDIIQVHWYGYVINEEGESILRERDIYYQKGMGVIACKTDTQTIQRDCISSLRKYKSDCVKIDHTKWRVETIN